MGSRTPPGKAAAPVTKPHRRRCRLAPRHLPPYPPPTRLALALILAATPAAALPAAAWEFRAGPVCEMTHAEPAAQVRVTFDPAIGLYAIAITLDRPWPSAPVFAIRFDPNGPAISTGRHVLSDDGRTLTVTDSGFGNVLDGLQFNRTATAFVGAMSVTIPLDGPAPAAPAVAQFRACPAAPSV